LNGCVNDPPHQSFSHEFRGQAADGASSIDGFVHFHGRSISFGELAAADLIAP
jgi:hypothetical protein